MELVVWTKGRNPGAERASCLARIELTAHLFDALQRRFDVDVGDGKNELIATDTNDRLVRPDL